MQIGARLTSRSNLSSSSSTIINNNNNIYHNNSLNHNSNIESNLSLTKDIKDFKEKHNKDYTCFHRMFSMGNLKFITKYLVILFIIIIVVLIGLKSNNHNLFNNLLSKDRSEAYNVKVLPDNLDDTSLILLDKEAFSYLAMIDAGSSGCRAHVYRYGKLGSIKGPLYVLPQHESFKVKPGLSTFANHPQDAGVSLKGLIDFLKVKVPEIDWAVTPIWLKATAGLRMLPTSESRAILDSIKDFLLNTTNSPFLFRPSWATIIPGNEEGGFGWIAYNYLMKIIGPKKNILSKNTPYAVVEMGGASAQVSQVAPNEEEAAKIPKEYRFSFTIEDETFHLYTHSYLGYGAEQAREKLNEYLIERKTTSHTTATTKPAVDSSNDTDSLMLLHDPCINRGYTRPSDIPPSDYYHGPHKHGIMGIAATPSPSSTTPQCTSLLESIIKKNNYKCDASKEPFSIECIHQPRFVTESPNFLVFENFFYVSSGIGVKPLHGNITTFPLITTPQQIKQSSYEVCGLDYNSLQLSYPKDQQSKDVNIKLCFLSSYAYNFLIDGLKLSKDKVITIQKEVGSSEIEWALGAAYKEAADLLKRTNLRPT